MGSEVEDAKDNAIIRVNKSSLHIVQTSILRLWRDTFLDDRWQLSR